VKVTTQAAPACPAGQLWNNTTAQCVDQLVVCGGSSQPCTGLPPAGLTATVKGSWIDLAWTIPDNLNANIANVTVTRSPPWPGAVTTQTQGPPNLTSMNDVLAVAGVPYSYKVCLNYKQSPDVFQPASACASASAKVPCPVGDIDNSQNQCVQAPPSPLGANQVQLPPGVTIPVEKSSTVPNQMKIPPSLNAAACDAKQKTPNGTCCAEGLVPQKDNTCGKIGNAAPQAPSATAKPEPKPTAPKVTKPIAKLTTCDAKQKTPNGGCCAPGTVPQKNNTCIAAIQ